MTYYHSRKRQQTRREFLQRAAAYSVLGSGAAAVNGKLGLIGKALAQSSDYSDLTDYKSLVCIFLYGGSDSFNMFIPGDSGSGSQFAEYQNSRGGLALEENQTTLDAGSTVRFNALLPNLLSIYNAGDLAVVRNVGNLIDVVSKTPDGAINGTIPSELFAHNHQQEQWLKGISSRPRAVVSSGWGGRMADLLQTANPAATLNPVFTISGSNFWSPGRQTVPLSLHPERGLDRLVWHESGSRAALFEDVMSAQHVHVLQEEVRQRSVRASAGSARINAALGSADAPGLATDFNTTFGANDDTSQLAMQLRMVARLIANREALNMHRQLFFVSLGGWDTHDNQAPRLDALLQELDFALQAFYTEMGPNGQDISDTVTTFTASDFGRTLTINGDGSDHGWGGHYMVMGGAVEGGQLYGDWPDFTIGGNQDMGDKGRIIPAYSINQYGASMARWMGLSESDLSGEHGLFPDLSNFSETLQLFTSET